MIASVAVRIGHWISGESRDARFTRLLTIQGLGAAGDALIALALAGSLYFSVPEADARSRVALYLAFTLAPFAVVAPLVSASLDRHHAALRLAFVVSAVGRFVLAWLLATRLETLYLFPLAFGLLVLSRASLIARGAVLPGLVDRDRSLVSANAALTKVSALGGMIAVPLGLALVQWPGVEVEMLLAAATYLFGVIPAFGLPVSRQPRSSEWKTVRKATRPITVRQALAATGAMRFLIGFLVFHLAFSLRREDLSSVGLATLVAAAAVGTLLGASMAPRMRRGLREEGIIVVALMLGGLAGVAVGRWFSLGSAAVLVLVFGAASGAAKLAFDSIVQRDTPEEIRGWSFARFESGLQLAWVSGAMIPVVVPIGASLGTFLTGVCALLVSLVMIVARARSAESP
jgi:hypothetical protein